MDINKFGFCTNGLNSVTKRPGNKLLFAYTRYIDFLLGDLL